MKKLALLLGFLSFFFLAPLVVAAPQDNSLEKQKAECYGKGQGWEWSEETGTCVYSTGTQGGGTSGNTGGSPFTNSGGGSINTTYLGGYVKSIIGIINTMIVPIIVALAFLLFVWGVYKYYFQAGEGDRAKGHMFILWAVIGFVVIFSVWGIVNLVRTTLNLDQAGTTAPKPPSI